MRLQAEDKDRMLAELAQAVADPVIPEGYYAAAEVAEALGTDYRTAKNRLDSRVRSGEVEVLYIGRFKYYKLVSEEEEDGKL